MKLSIIIPTMLRDIAILELAIKSVAYNFSKIFSFEIIVVNDNEELDINDLCFKKLRGIKELNFFNNINMKKGAASARNFGVSNAKGTLITFLDDDDFILPGRLECMVEEFLKRENDGCIMVSTGRLFQYNNFEYIGPQSNQKIGIVQLSDIKIINDIDIGFLMRKDFFLSKGGFDTSFTNLEDWEFIMRCLKSGYCYKIKTYSYVVKNDPRPHRVSNNSCIGLNEISDKYRKEYGEHWYYTIKVLVLRSSNRFKFKDFLYLTFKLKNLYPLRHFVPYTFKKLRSN